MYPTITIFGKTIGTYGLCSIAGLLLCVFLAVKLGKDKKYGIEDMLLLMIAVSVGMLIGGHIMYAITQGKSIINLFASISSYSPKEFISKFLVYISGMVYYGGFLGALGALVIYCRFNKKTAFKDMIDIFAVCIPLFHVFGRIGCFFAGCCYGIESSWGFLITDNEINPSVNGVTRLPIQLIEAACNLFIFLTLLFLYKKGRFKEKLIFIYMIIYPICRFILEFFRGDEIRGFVGVLSTSQFISILLIIVSILHLFFLRKKNNIIKEG